MKILFVVGRHAYGDPARGEGYEYANMLPALRSLGHEVAHFESFDRSRYSDFAALNAAFLDAMERERPDLALCVFMTCELWTETLDLVRSTFPATIVNWGTDDSWKYAQFARHIAPHVDCYATTWPAARDRARQDRFSNWVLTQWAANDAMLAVPLSAHECGRKVSFIGAAYGNRRRWVEDLKAAGIEVECFGHGWPNGPVASAEVPRIIRDSVISLNFADSGIHWRGAVPYRSRQIKARVFEVPGAGGFLLTQTADHLDRYYRLGEEIVAFDSADQLIERVRHFLAHPQERDRIAIAGHERTRREHSYSRRLESLLDEAMRLRERDRGRHSGGDFLQARQTLEMLVQSHRSGPWLKALRTALVLPFRLVWGEQRGPRAARRLLYELSWRLAGAKTYSATGWPGRLFYRES